MKPIIVISTVGQSVFFNVDKNLPTEARDFASTLEAESSDFEADLEKIRADIKGFPGENIYNRAIKALEARQDELKWMYQSSAEMHSLLRIIEDAEPNTNDALVFLASDTADGVLAARIISDFATLYLGRQAEVHIVRGLQVQDGTLFRRKGLPNLIRLLYSLLKSHPSGTYQRVINPTGGFKGVVPYLTIIGMLHEAVEISYVYERSPELISLSGMPLALDYDRLEPYEPVLAMIADAGVMSESDVLAELDISERGLASLDIWPLIDLVDIDGEVFVELNGLGTIGLEHMRVEKTTPVYLSRQADTRYKKATAGSEELQNFKKILNEIHAPYLRESNMHTVPNRANALVYKLGRKKERGFYLVKDDHILVLELARHINATDYDIYPTVAKDYERFRLWEGD